MTEEKDKKIDDPVHDMILQEIREANQKIDDLTRRIFLGNGQKSLVDRINKNSMVTKVIVWCVGVLYTAFVSVIVAAIFRAAT